MIEPRTAISTHGHGHNSSFSLLGSSDTKSLTPYGVLSDPKLRSLEGRCKARLENDDLWPNQSIVSQRTLDASAPNACNILQSTDPYAFSQENDNFTRHSGANAFSVDKSLKTVTGKREKDDVLY